MSLNTALTTADRELVIRRVFDAPRELVYQVWTDPKHIGQWWGPNGFSITTHAMDVRPGGIWRYTMHGPDGMEFPTKVAYLEVVPNERLVYLLSDDDPALEPVSFHVTTTFEALTPAKTQLQMRMVFPTAADRDRVEREYGAVDGARQTITRLGDYVGSLEGASKASDHNTMVVLLPDEFEFVLARRFKAPRELVWDCFTKPEHLKRWWGCAQSTLSECEVDLRVGGKFRSVIKMPDGTLCPFKGEYQQIEKPTRLVHTYIFDVEPYNQHPALVTVTFTEENGQTLVKETTRHATTEARDGHLNSGLEGGAIESFNNLEALLAQLASSR